MNNDIIFEIAKYLEKKTGFKKLDEAFESQELLKYKMDFSSNSLEKKLNSRPTLEDLMNRNIIRTEPTDFDYIHAVLETIDFRENSNRISPKIAGIVKKLDFKLKKSLIIRKLNLSKNRKDHS